MLLFENSEMEKALKGQPFEISDYPFFYPLSPAFTMLFRYVGKVDEARADIIRKFVADAFDKVKRDKYEGQLINVDPNGFKVDDNLAPTLKPIEKAEEAEEVEEVEVIPKKTKPKEVEAAPNVETTVKPVEATVEEEIPVNVEPTLSNVEILFKHEFQGCTFEVRKEDEELKVFNTKTNKYISSKSPHARTVMKAYKESNIDSTTKS